ALWAVRGEATTPALPLFAAAEIADEGRDHRVNLPVMPTSEEVIQDYQTTRLSLKDHPMTFLRSHYNRMRIMTTHDACAAPDGTRLMTAGIVLIRQRPGSAKGVFFITIEDETGVANLVVWPKVGAVYRPVVMGARILMIKGRVQRADAITHIVADQLIDRTDDLRLLSEDVQRKSLDNILAHADHGRAPLPASGDGVAKRLAKLPKDDPLLTMLARADEVRRPIPEDRRSGTSLRTHPRNVRVIPKSRDFH
ncbi:MAG: OB-fold nucleic acid binding domain-containing protein, partial [Pseudomonadota bacterium]